MITLKDIARRANVNVSTVSKALNGSPSISEAKREEIFRISQELGYAPTARNKVGKSSKMIGILVPEVESVYFSSMFSALEAMVLEAGYLPLLYETNFDEKLEEKGFELFIDKNTDGILNIMPSSPQTRHLVADAAQKHHIPTIIMVSSDPEYQDVHTVLSDEQEGMDLAVRSLREHGSRRIGFISDELNRKYRFSLFQESLRRLNLPFDESICCFSRERFEEGGYLCLKTLHEKGLLPEALICGYDDIAIGAMRYAAEQEIRIPGELSLIGFDNSRVGAYLTPSLSTVAHPIEQMSRSSVQLLLQLMEQADITGITHQIRLRPTLITRETS